MKNHGNICVARRVVAVMLLFISVVSVLAPQQIVKADTVTKKGNLSARWYTTAGSVGQEKYHTTYVDNLSCSGSAPIYSFIIRPTKASGYDESNKVNYYYFMMGYVSSESFTISGSQDFITPSGWTSVSGGIGTGSVGSSIYTSAVYTGYGRYYMGTSYSTQPTNLKADIVITVNDITVNSKDTDLINGLAKLGKFVKSGEKSDGMMFDVGKSSDYSVNNESIGYLENLRINLSYTMPVKDDPLLTSGNNQIYTDMVYQLRWNGDKSSTGLDLKNCSVQVACKGEYKESWDSSLDVKASDFFDVAVVSDATRGKVQYSYKALYKKAPNCVKGLKSQPLVDIGQFDDPPAGLVADRVRFKFYLRIVSGDQTGPWLCVDEKGNHVANEFIKSGDKVKSNISSGSLDSNGDFKKDDKVDYNNTGVTGAGTDEDDAIADTNANDKTNENKKQNNNNTTWDNLESFVDGIGSVPSIIADIFSFLPSWCLNIVATGFALMITILVIKFIRG